MQANPGYARRPVAPLLRASPRLCRVVTHATLALELTAPLLSGCPLSPPLLRAAGVAGLVAMHIGRCVWRVGEGRPLSADPCARLLIGSSVASSVTSSTVVIHVEGVYIAATYMRQLLSYHKHILSSLQASSAP